MSRDEIKEEMDEFDSAYAEFEQKVKESKGFISNSCFRNAAESIDEAMSILSSMKEHLGGAKYSVKCMFPDYELSDNQKLFIEDAKEQGFEISYDYSGRAMYGRKCPSIRVDGMGEFRTEASISTDNLGLGYVLYAES